MTGSFLFYVWLIVGCCACLWAWLKANGWAALLLAVAWLMLGVVLHLIA